MTVERAVLSAEHVRRGLPHPVGVSVRYLSALGALPLRPLDAIEEAALGPRAIERRRVLFALGRAVAHDGLRELGVADAPIARGTGGEPLWPEEVVGAISHSNELAVAVVGRRRDYVGLGVDVEELARGPSARAARLLCRPSEIGWVDLESGTERLAMLFSAKEAIFKALYPIEHVWLGFTDAELTWRADQGVFAARVFKSVGRGYPAGFGLTVNVTVGATWVLSTAFVPATRSDARMI